MKDLPKVYANPIDKNLNNNRSFSYGKLENDKKIKDEQTVLKKIDKLFKSEGNIYSIDCIITFRDGLEKYTIIGRTSNNLVTRTEKLIPIKDIYDIELA